MTSPLLHLWYYFVYDYQSSCHALMLSSLCLDVIKSALMLSSLCLDVIKSALMLSSLCLDVVKSYLDVIKSMPWCYQVYALMLSSLCLDVIKSMPWCYQVYVHFHCYITDIISSMLASITLPCLHILKAIAALSKREWMNVRSHRDRFEKLNKFLD